ncbi:ABC-three component system middle component 7 [Anaerosphaera multitolerans]|jgi:hypothetical protein|uniref:DprA winged helix domain-containing protein n=1 Tax=Anaerosphaera multitolerans TaxID=2487351 RepID=A0A437S9Q0_9FIRM|nr:ABC-three component system middle component 7 [Anaerosphaera multitolerans]RVU55873.1 hypothetical protein EF514_01280 [Anaerosphaera multitolerans]
MLLPNKLFSYSETALSKIPYVLEVLDEPLSPSEILHSIGGVLGGPLELIYALDILYALGEIRLIENEGRITRCSKK